jgi:hypothetical protein
VEQDDLPQYDGDTSAAVIGTSLRREPSLLRERKKQMSPSTSSTQSRDSRDDKKEPSPVIAAATSASSTTKDVNNTGSNEKPDANATMRSLPSPILVHSRKPIREDYLRKFTDYSKPSTPKTLTPPRRPMLERSASQKSRQSVSHLSPETTSSSNSNVLPSHVEAEDCVPVIACSDSAVVTSSSTESVPLFKRRHGVSKLHVDIDRPSLAVPSNLAGRATHSDDDRDEDDRDDDDDASQSDDVSQNQNQSAAVYTTARIESDTLVSTTAAAADKIDDEEELTLQPKMSFNDLMEATAMETPENSDTPPMPASSSHTTLAIVTQLTPILTSLQSDYTTITDEIDTSCMMDRSPSPTTACAFFPSDGFFESSDSKATEASKTKNKLLKRAEEIEHRRMTKVIKDRLRQISLDDSDSISDIARLVVSEMNSSEEDRSNQDDSDDDDEVESNVSIVSTASARDSDGPIEMRARSSSPMSHHGNHGNPSESPAKC